MKVLVSPVYVQEVFEDGPATVQYHGVEVLTVDGRRYHHFRTFYSFDEAAKLVRRVEAAIADKGWKPEDSEHWNRGDDVYGSEAYQRNGGEHQLQKADVEAEFGPGSYFPGGPGYLEQA